ncbi:MAG: GNAT family N-acetyltransferase, partial [Oscillospiraceae bacterium]
MPIEIYPAYQEIGNVRTLFKEYAAWLGVDLCFQSFEAELQSLPGLYAPPGGRLYLARCEGELAGCAALKPVAENGCELKRLYVRPACRGRKIGRLLLEKMIADAKEMHYSAMRLDTFASLTHAVALYRQAGFCTTEPYYENPLENVLYMSL